MTASTAPRTRRTRGSRPRSAPRGATGRAGGFWQVSRLQAYHSPGMMRSRRASVLFIVLIVLLLLIAGVAVIQRLSLDNVYRTQSLLLFEDGLHRADGVIEL